MRTKHSSKAESCVEDAAGKFIHDRIESVFSFGDGRINDTYRLNTDKAGYICQRIRGSMDTGILEHNYLLYSEAFEKAGLLFPKWMKTEEDSYFYTDADGQHWRMYPFINGEISTIPLYRDMIFACGKGLAGLHRILQTLWEKPLAVFPMHHDLEYYYDHYLWVLNNDLSGEERDEELEKYISIKIRDFLDIRTDRSAVIHGDPKLANILFERGKIKAFIDLDTVMPGSLSEDIADCARSCCENEGNIDADMLQVFLQGYQSEGADLLSSEEAELLPQMISKICFELGLRYYTDAVAKKKSFKEKHPGYLLNKARMNLMKSE